MAITSKRFTTRSPVTQFLETDMEVADQRRERNFNLNTVMDYSTERPYFAIDHVSSAEFVTK